MRDPVEELYDYGAVRKLDQATMFVVRLDAPTLVLGGSQPLEVLDLARVSDTPVRRRRGGGGLVLLQPGDIWVDWWLPSHDPRWDADVHVSSLRAGGWWRDTLRTLVPGDVGLHEGALEGALAHRVLCFAGRGPGEVFVDGRKAVGVTQWRVREGIFLSTVLHANASAPAIEFLRDVPPGLLDVLDHHVLGSLGISEPDRLIETLGTRSGPWQLRQHLLVD